MFGSVRGIKVLPTVKCCDTPHIEREEKREYKLYLKEVFENVYSTLMKKGIATCMLAAVAGQDFCRNNDLMKKGLRLSMDSELYDMLKELSKEEGRNISAQIAFMTKEYIKEKEEIKKFREIYLKEKILEEMKLKKTKAVGDTNV